MLYMIVLLQELILNLLSPQIILEVNTKILTPKLNI